MISYNCFSIFKNVLNWETTSVDRVSASITISHKEILIYD